jgi:2-dehydro-3-deoxy-phosphogluconate aldolase
MMDFAGFSFYKDRVALNLLAKDPANAGDVLEAIDGNGVIGILSRDFSTVEEGVEFVKAFQKVIPVISIGLGDGDPNRWEMAAGIAVETDPGHVNQVFTTAGFTQGLLYGRGCRKTIVNALISPSGQPGKVKISTGPFSSGEKDAVIDADTAVTMLKDAGIKSVKFFPIKGDKTLDELKELAESCVKHGIPMIEPTGGINADNIYSIVRTCIDAGCEKVIPHVYSSAVDKQTGLTDLAVVRKLYDSIKKVFK